MDRTARQRDQRAADRFVRRLDRAQARRPMRWIYCVTYHGRGVVGRIEIFFDRKITTIEHVKTIEASIAANGIPAATAVNWKLLRVEPMPGHAQRSGSSGAAEADATEPEFHSHHRTPHGDGVPCGLGLWHDGPCEPIATEHTLLIDHLETSCRP